jgi:hypothetical protein
MTLELSHDEAMFLQELVTRYLADMKSEIYRTETPAFKDDLKVQESLAKTLLGRLAGAAAA